MIPRLATPHACNVTQTLFSVTELSLLETKIGFTQSSPRLSLPVVKRSFQKQTFKTSFQNFTNEISATANPVFLFNICIRVCFIEI